MSTYKHNARSYLDVYNQYKAKYPTQPDWLFSELAGLFDAGSELTNNIANDIMNPITKESAYSFGDRCAYSPIESDGGIVEMTITLNSAMAKTLTAGYQVGGISDVNGGMIIFELIANASSGGTDTIIADFKQKSTYTDLSFDSISSVIPYYEIRLNSYENILKDTFILKIDSVQWTQVDNFDNSISTDEHYKLIYQSNGKCRVRFGDGTFGKLPSNNDSVSATFAVTQGLQGALNAGKIIVNVGNDTDIKEVTNAASVIGSAAESITSIIENSQTNIRAKNIVWSVEDLNLSARQASSNVVKTYSVPSLGTATIYVVPSGGGSPSAGLKTTVSTYVQSKTQFGLMPIIVNDPNYQAENITATITVRPGFVQATVEDLTEFAMTLLSSAYDVQVIEYYKDYGIDKTRVDIINTLWAWSFTSDENPALEFIINKWVELLGSSDSREFGQPLEVGQIWIMGDSLYNFGLDIFSLTTPTTNQICDVDEIISTGTITIT